MKNSQDQKTKGAENLSNSFQSSLVQLEYELETLKQKKKVRTVAQLLQDLIFS